MFRQKLARLAQSSSNADYTIGPASLSGFGEDKPRLEAVTTAAPATSSK